jgi:hypothetical protein
MVHGCDALDLHAFESGKTADQDQKRKTYKTGITDAGWYGTRRCVGGKDAAYHSNRADSMSTVRCPFRGVQVIMAGDLANPGLDGGSLELL